MRTLFIVILLSGVFLGGYQLGQQETSPDIVGEARSAWAKMDKVLDSLDDLGKKVRNVRTEQEAAICWVEDDVSSR